MRMKRQVNLGVITLFASLLISCATPAATPATLTPPPDLTPISSAENFTATPRPPVDSTPMSSPEDFTATPRPPTPIPTSTALTPTPPPPPDTTGTSGFDWEGPAILYDGLKLSNY